MSLFDTEKLEHVLQAHWTEFMDRVQVMRVVLEHVRDNPYRVITQAEIPPRQIKMTATKFSLKVNEATFNTPESCDIEVWIEFTVPKDSGVVIGTVIGNLSWSGELYITNSFGTEFQELKPHPQS